MTTVQLRVDEKTKKDVKKVLDNLGLDMSTAVKLYLKQITLHKGIPFPLVTENGFTINEENEILKATKEAKEGKNVSKAMSTKQFLKELKML